MKRLMSVLLIIALTGIVFIPGILATQENEVAPAKKGALATQEVEFVPIDIGPSTGLVVLDLLVVRPFCVAGSIASTAFCIATMPGAFLCGVGEQSARIFVEAPWRFTAGRPLGEFNTYRDGKPITHNIER